MSERNEEAAREAIEAIRLAQENGDIEAAHSDADDALCGLLRSLGYEDVVREWNRVEKWYA